MQDDPPKPPSVRLSVTTETLRDHDDAFLPAAATTTTQAAAPPDGDEKEPTGAAAIPGRIVPSMTNWQFGLLFLGLNVAIFLAALDQTIVSVALQAISTEYSAQDQVAWVATAYLLTATAFIPSYGQVSDIFGRKPTFLFAIVVFELGSALCGAANSMIMLIVARAVAGIGGGGIFSLVMIIISDVVPIQDRAKWSGLIGAAFGLASVAGPLLGGVFVDHLSWRWVFYINLPVGAIAIITVILFLHVDNRPGAPRTTTTTRLSALARIDWLGTGLLVAAVLCILIPLEGGGTQYPWDSPIVKALFPIGGILLAAFVYVEGWVAVNPIIPPKLVGQRHVAAALVTAFFFGATFFGMVFYAPQWFQVVLDASATSAGIRSLPIILGLVIFGVAVGIISSNTGHAWPFLPLGGALLALSAGLTTLLNETSPLSHQVVFFLLAGIGSGLAFQMLLLIAQFSVDPAFLSAVTAITNFSQTIGGVLGLAAFSVAFNAKLPVFVQESLKEAGVETLHFTVEGVTVESLYKSGVIVRRVLPDDEWPPVIHGYVRALQLVFWMTVPFAGAVVVAAMFMKKSRLPSSRSAEATIAL
ncbi:major facilitator superfamily domain-containing protein [Zopfochytrium polystomum]|nr:major facilitator superfamily domain-containing protein [Zopfochytrium polystomum]